MDIRASLLALALFVVLLQYFAAAEILDTQGKYHLTWEPSSDGESITFNIVVETTGFVGFGISPNGDMLGSDVIIGGVNDDGTYFSDRHVTAYSEPVVDASQDWEAVSIDQNATHTSLVVKRLLDTCDDDDLPITSDTLKLIWSYGATDNTATGHGGNRGTVSINLLDPPMPPFDGTGLDVWTITMNATMPTQETTYWCSMHKSPPGFDSTRYVVGFDIRLPTGIDVKHTHHLVVFRCRAPDGEDPETAFGRYIGEEGGDCFKDAPYTTFHDLCRSPFYAWAVGGKTMTFPDDIGLPITDGGETEYVMIEMHYDNPQIVPGVRVTSLLDVYSTTQPRPITAQVGVLMTEMNYSHVIPPNQDGFVTVAHCSAACTSGFIPPTGTFIFNILLHAHKAGRSLKLRHWRNGVELPWIISDDHYDFDFQQNRPLKEPRQVLPGDHLAVECRWDTRNRGGNVTIAGYGTMEEMCQVIFYTYPQGSWGSCSSWHDQPKFLDMIGLEDVEWPILVQPAIITAPPALAGRPYLEYLNRQVNWTPELIANLQRESRYTSQVQVCASQLMPVTYPQTDKEYAPEDTCADRPTTTTTESSASTARGSALTLLSTLLLFAPSLMKNC